jgi:subtilisin family serine protease
MKRPNLLGGAGLPFAAAGGAEEAAGARAAHTGRHIVVFRNGATDEGIQVLKAAGLKVVTSDASPQGVMREDQAGDADAIVFTRLGTALVAAEPDKISLLSNSASDAGSPIRSVRPEKVRYALPYGEHGAAVLDTTRPNTGYAHPPNVDGSPMGEALSSAGVAAPAPEVAHQPDETQITYGLQITRAAESPFSGRGVRVAILDTGMEFAVVEGRVEYHPDFAGRTIVTESFVPGAPTAKDDHGHGTHCVGTACGPRQPATTKPGYGVAYSADIYVGKVLNHQGAGADGWIQAGIEWAIKNKCQVVSMSLGSLVDTGAGFDDMYEQIAQRALDAGTLIVAAAGNDSLRPGDVLPVSAPANCPSIFAVAAVDFDLSLAFFSNGGINPSGGEVNIAAPGVGVYSSYLAPTLHTRMSGTSMATPHVAGIAALYAEANPGVMGKQLWDMLARDARPLPLSTRDAGVGLVQAPLNVGLAHDHPRRSIETHDPIIIDGGSARIDFNHEAIAPDPIHPSRFFSREHFISGLIFRNNETRNEVTLTVPPNGNCTITIHCDFQGNDRPIVISGRLVQIFFDPAEYPLDSLNPREHRSARRRITGIDIRDDNPNGQTTFFRNVPSSGLCRISVVVGHP